MSSSTNKTYMLASGEKVQLTTEQIKAATAIFGEDFIRFLDEKDAAKAKLGSKAATTPPAAPAPEEEEPKPALPGLPTGPGKYECVYEDGQFKFILVPSASEKAARPGKQSAAANYFNQGQNIKGYESAYFGHIGQKVRRL